MMNVLSDNAHCSSGKKEKNTVLIKPPKPFWNLEIQCMVTIVSGPLIVASILGYAHMAKTPIILVFSGTALFTIFAILYFVEHVSKIIISGEEKLQLYNKGVIINEYNLSDIKEFVARYTRLSLELPKYELIMVKNTDESVVLFNAKNFFSKNQWDNFSEKISSVAKKPLRKECLLENYEGEVVSVTCSKVAVAKKRTLLLVVSQLCMPFIAALGFRFFPTIKSFIFWGIFSILINIAVSIFYGFMSEIEIKKFSGSYTIFIFFVVRSSIMSLFVYVFYVFILMGTDAFKIFH